MIRKLQSVSIKNHVLLRDTIAMTTQGRPQLWTERSPGRSEQVLVSYSHIGIIFLQESAWLRSSGPPHMSPTAQFGEKNVVKCP